MDYNRRLIALFSYLIIQDPNASKSKFCIKWQVLFKVNSALSFLFKLFEQEHPKDLCNNSINNNNRNNINTNDIYNNIICIFQEMKARERVWCAVFPCAFSSPRIFIHILSWYQNVGSVEKTGITGIKLPEHLKKIPIAEWMKNMFEMLCHTLPII